MEIIKQDAFLKLFKSDAVTYSEFIKKAKVRVGRNLRPLSEYIKEKQIDTGDIKTLFENIRDRNEYLSRFYHLSLRIEPDRIHFMTEPMKNKHFNNNTESTYKNLIRNLHYKDILKNTKSGMENVPTYLDMLFDLYKNLIIDYKILTPSAIHYMNAGRLGSVFSSYYFRASIMNPYLVYSLNKSVLHGKRIFTPTLGWSSYCYGFLECQEVLEYVGTDVIPSVCEKTKLLAKSLSPKLTVDIYCKPSEDLLKSNAFMSKYKGHFDVVFFSPPYYRLEMYDGKDQSTARYQNYEEWLEKYWKATIQLCHHVLEKGGKMCYILSGYGSDNTKEKYDLLSDMNSITKTHFKLLSRQPMYNKDVYVRTKENETGEEIMIFTKQ
jgi:hypothetical protein